ncbi:hypothetical protein [Novosphingobium sp.]|uniref:hypothetical protein n=1 Tax=Novosphingobium sp. TaxID=1874826 RepID=UPI001EC5D1D9|nr:hypothetical protein [Novosphingobium sp.]MBK9012307.1 hypothetical protein [Novosphingobium sp.]
MKTTLTATLAVLAASLAATAAIAQTRPAQTAQPARPAQQAQQPQQQQVQINSVPLLCRVREQEIVAINRLVGDRNQALQRETDPNRRQALNQQLQNFVNNLRETEASWSRMECAKILYGAR